MGVLQSHAPYVSDNDTSMLHPHWRTVERVSPTYNTTVAVIMIVLAVGAMIGNGIVIWGVKSFRSLRTTSNMFIVNLSVGNLLMSTIDFPLLITASFINDWPFGYVVCQLYGMVTGLAGLVTINSLAVIAVNRYISVSGYRVVSIAKVSRTKTFKAILFTWVYALMWSSAPVFGWGAYRLDGVRTTCTFDFLTRTTPNICFIICMCIFEFLLPVIAITFAYIRIFTVMILRRRELDLSVTARKSKNVALRLTRQQYRVKAELRTALIIIGLVILFIVAWLPYTIVALIGLFGDQSILNPVVSSVAGLFAKTSTVYNPVVYAISHPKFKKKLKSYVFNDADKTASHKQSSSRHNKKSSLDDKDGDKKSVEDIAEMSRR